MSISKIKRVTFGSRKRRVVTVLSVLALVGASAGLAAWIILSGASGQGAGKVGSGPTSSDALTFTPNPGIVTQPVAPGSPGSIGVTVKNNASVTETVTGVTGTITTSIAGCAAHLSINSSAFTSTPIPGGFNGPWEVTGALVADNSLPANCANSDVTVNLTGTTNP